MKIKGISMARRAAVTSTSAPQKSDTYLRHLSAHASAKKLENQLQAKALRGKL